MKHLFLFLYALVWPSFSLPAQELPNSTLEQQLENLAESMDGPVEDDAYAQQLQHWRKQPLDINAASEGELLVFRWLTGIQIHHLIEYRKLLGLLIDVHELQAVPAWDIETIRKTLPFIYAGNGIRLATMLSSRWKNGENSLLLRVSQVLEPSKGYQSADNKPSPYPGSPQRLLLRYKYQYKNLMQYGILGEKDPGEPFLKGQYGRGFDFYSFHFFLRQHKSIRQFALGDYTVNLGQGLLLYQSMAFRKGADVLNLKRQTEIFRPYNSPGEANFFRGAALALGQGVWRAALFAARQQISANIMLDSSGQALFATSLLESGLHRTQAERAERRNVQQTAMGGMIKYKGGRWHVAVNGVQYLLELPLLRNTALYQQFGFNGHRLGLASVDYSYTWRNLHAFGELATNASGGGRAMVHGMLASLGSRADVSLLYRNLSRDFQSLHGNAFTEGTSPGNEKGMYAGLVLRPAPSFQLSVYADVFRFPWLRYRVDRPSDGREYLAQLTWKPNKQVELYTRFRSERKALNTTAGMLPLTQTENVNRRNWRTHLSFRVSQALTLRTRMEWVWYDHSGFNRAEGFLWLADALWKPMTSRLSLGGRLSFFETTDYNSRIYAYENDVLYSYAIPAFSGKGYRYYGNISYDITRLITLWLRVAQTTWPGEETVGSGLDEINGSRRTDLKVQLLFRW